MLSEGEINLVKELDNLATKGPWAVCETDDGKNKFIHFESDPFVESLFDKTVYTPAESNAKFAAIARELLPKAIKEILALREELDAEIGTIAWACKLFGNYKMDKAQCFWSNGLCYNGDQFNIIEDNGLRHYFDNRKEIKEYFNMK